MFSCNCAIWAKITASLWQGAGIVFGSARRHYGKVARLDWAKTGWFVVMMVAVGGVLLGGCSSIQQEHGFRFVGEDPFAFTPRIDSQKTVQQRLGSPSFKSQYNADGVSTWSYVSSISQKRGFALAEIQDRQVVVIKFDSNGRVLSVDRLGYEDGRQIALIEDITSNQTRDTTLLQEVFAGIGRFDESLRNALLGELQRGAN